MNEQRQPTESRILGALEMRAPIHHIDYLNAAPRGRGIQAETLEVRRATVAALPPQVSAIVLTSDLQGRERGPGGRPGRLLGHLVAETLATLSDLGDIPPLNTSLALLCGDLYTVPALDRRGGLGPVGEVWRAFGEVFGEVVGISGNHDDLCGHTVLGERATRDVGGATWLDGGVVSAGGLRIGGVSGVMGNPRKPNRHHPETYVEQIEAVVDGAPDIVLLHEDPVAGDGRISGAISALRRPTCVAFGHRHKRWWHREAHGADVRIDLLSVDARVLVIEAAPVDVG